MLEGIKQREQFKTKRSNSDSYRDMLLDLFNIDDLELIKLLRNLNFGGTMEYLKINKNYWDTRVESHVESEFYAMNEFLAGNSSLRFIELEHLPKDLSGKKILHLQCHFGQDSLSLARMGAEVTGLDLSSEAIKKAKELNDQLGLNATFVESDVYNAKNHIHEKFDMVFTSYGTIGWLPDLDKWADIVNHFLKLGGEFLIAEFHPAVWMFDDDFTHVKHSYFNIEPIKEVTEGTYTEKGKDLREEFIGWNHHLGEVFTALQGQGLQIKSFTEYDTAPWPCFRDLVEVDSENYRKGYQIKGMEGKLPMVYALQCTKP